MYKNIVVGRKLKFLRESINLNQRDAADKIGVTPSSLSRFESGQRLPSRETMNRICNAYNISMSFLLEEDPIKF